MNENRDEEEDDYLPGEAVDEMTSVKLAHDRYLKAVNHPIRKRILEILTKMGPVSRDELGRLLVEEKMLRDADAVGFHLDFLEKAKCIRVDKENSLVQVTKEGEVVDCLDK